MTPDGPMTPRVGAAGRLRRAWETWVRLWAHEEHPRLQGAIRLGVGLCLLWDFGWIAGHDLVVPLLGGGEAGGWAPNMAGRDAAPLVYKLLPATPEVAWAFWGVLFGSALTFSLGLFTRASALVLLLAYAQSSFIVPAGDRGIDMLLRNVVMVFVFASGGAWLSLDAWRRTGSLWGDGRPRPAWPRHLLVLQLIVMYFIAGVTKLDATWLPMGGYTALWFILQDTGVARFDVAAWSEGAQAALWWPSRLGTAVTTLWELGTPLLLAVFWARHSATAASPGWKGWVIRWRPERAWMAIGVLFHVLIAITLDLGIFPFAMLALYPCLTHPSDWVRREAPNAASRDAADAAAME